MGNTLIVVEHDEDTIRAADYLVDVGPKAGVHGGEIVAFGTQQDVMNAPRSIKGDFLAGRRKIEVPETRNRSALQSATRRPSSNSASFARVLPISTMRFKVPSAFSRRLPRLRSS